MKIFELNNYKKELDKKIREERKKIHKYLFDNGVFDILHFECKPLMEYKATRDNDFNYWQYGDTNLSSFIHVKDDNKIKFEFTKYIDGYEEEYIELILSEEELNDPKLLINKSIEKMGEYLLDKLTDHITKDQFREIRLKQIL
ncbi:MAG: hypothetical protein SLAVMIC_00218 [uncultured marine phage]|uniref:Uncharacterized protein n=1 Tax=uncultured marine phage TaxID=707152 RepID=A0A8D9C8J5_9VIRU|nr:MAG: hypothetical protein SLAVMIC_00218 [uncultured marine phage]